MLPRIEGRLAIIAVSTVLLLIFGIAQHARSGLGMGHVLIIDSGSSGTRIYAYTWQTEPLSLPLVQAVSPAEAKELIPRKAGTGAYDRVETQPGLDRFADDPEGIEVSALGPLLDWARAVVPTSQHRSTPVFLLATAGLRKVSEASQHAVMTSARIALRRSGFRFEPSWARIISGVDEGVYGWVAMNYQQGKLRSLLEQQQLDPPQATSALGRHGGAAGSAPSQGQDGTLRALDLGGSSLEVTSSTSSGSIGSAGPASGQNVASAYHHAESAHVVLPGLDPIVLHTVTLRRYGLNDAFDRSVMLLLYQDQMLQQEKQKKEERASDAAARVGGVSAGGAAPATAAKADTAQSTSGAAASAMKAGALVNATESVSGATGSTLQHDAQLMSDLQDRAMQARPEEPQTAAGAPAVSTSVPLGWQAAAGKEGASGRQEGAHSGDRGKSDAGKAGKGTGDTAAKTNSNEAQLTRQEHAEVRRIALAGPTNEVSQSSSTGSRGSSAEDGGRAGNIIGISGSKGESSLAAGSRLRRLLALVSELAAGCWRMGKEAARRSGPSRTLLLSNRSSSSNSSSSPRSSSSSGSSQNSSHHPDGAHTERAPGANASTEATSLFRVQHPCLHSGYQATYHRLQDYGVMPSLQAVLLQGAPNRQACSRLAAQLVARVEPCAGACKSDMPKASQGGHAVALSGFFVVWRFFGLPLNASMQQVLDTSAEFCMRSWREVEIEKGDAVNKERYCLWGQYVINLLQLGLKVQAEQLTIGGGDFSWTMGAALVEASRLPEMRPWSSTAGTASFGHLSWILWGWTPRTWERLSWLTLITSAAALAAVAAAALLRSLRRRPGAVRELLLGLGFETGGRTGSRHSRVSGSFSNRTSTG